MSKNISLVFFGTGPVSLASLEPLANTFTIEAVITKPDATSPSGNPIVHPIKKWALSNNVTCHQPANKQELSDLCQPAFFDSQIGVVVDYGLIIPHNVIDAFPKGIINSHFSLLPRWRGADPLTFAVLEGDEESGVSLMLIDAGLDTGDLVAQESYQVPAGITTPQLTHDLIQLSNRMLNENIPSYLNGSIAPWPQPREGEVYSRKLTKADGKLDWNKPAVTLEREIRAFLGWPGSYTRLADKDVVITEAKVIGLEERGAPGAIIHPAKNKIAVVCGDGQGLEILRIKPAGKREMDAAAFTAGLRG